MLPPRAQERCAVRGEAAGFGVAQQEHLLDLFRHALQPLGPVAGKN